MKEQRKIITCLLAILYVFGLSACSSEKEFKPDYESAVGVIVVNDTEEIAASSKNYAAFENNRFTFDLDAAAVYYFDVDEEVSYAGDQNLSSLQFGANVDDETVAAVGTVTYKSGAQGTASAYYLYHDESGLYTRVNLMKNIVFSKVCGYVTRFITQIRGYLFLQLSP